MRELYVFWWRQPADERTQMGINEKLKVQLKVVRVFSDVPVTAEIR